MSAMLDQQVWSERIFLDGGWVPGSAGTREVVAPATGAVLARVGIAGPADVTRAAERAAAAQAGWAALPHTERAAVLLQAARLWTEHGEEISWWNTREAGAVQWMAAFALRIAEQECLEAAALPSHPFGELLPSEQPRLSMSLRMPAGVVAVISPFNAPINLGIRSVAPALALGNAVLLKPDPRTTVTGGVVMARVFDEAGLPPGVLQLLPGGADIGEAMIVDPHVRVVSFTGSTAAGRRVGELAARHLTRAHLELGGNNALLVLDDADVDAAVGLAGWGSFFNQGQICMSTGRHIVHERRYDDYVEALAAKAEALPIGDPAAAPVALGPLIDASQRDKVHDLVTSSLDAGARLAAGGTPTDLFYPATVLADATPSVPAFTREIFGPVAPVARFSTIDEAVGLATVSEYGLTLGVVTRDVLRGLAVADRIPTGIVHINDQTVNTEANIPFGGVAASGTGSRFGGSAANIEAFTETRWVTMRSTPPRYPF